VQSDQTALQNATKFVTKNTDRHPFNGLFSRTTWVSWHQKVQTNLDFNEARDDGVAVASAGPYANQLQTDNHASTSSINFLQAGWSKMQHYDKQRQWGDDQPVCEWGSWVQFGRCWSCEVECCLVHAAVTSYKPVTLEHNTLHIPHSHTKRTVLLKVGTHYGPWTWASFLEIRKHGPLRSAGAIVSDIFLLAGRLQ